MNFTNHDQRTFNDSNGRLDADGLRTGFSALPVCSPYSVLGLNAEYDPDFINNSVLTQVFITLGNATVTLELLILPLDGNRHPIQAQEYQIEGETSA